MKNYVTLVFYVKKAIKKITQVSKGKLFANQDMSKNNFLFFGSNASLINKIACL